MREDRTVLLTNLIKRHGRMFTISVLLHELSKECSKYDLCGYCATFSRYIDSELPIIICL